MNSWICLDKGIDMQTLKIYPNIKISGIIVYPFCKSYIHNQVRYSCNLSQTVAATKLVSRKIEATFITKFGKKTNL
jgi:hypothetical protein